MLQSRASIKTEVTDIIQLIIKWESDKQTNSTS